MGVTVPPYKPDGGKAAVKVGGGAWAPCCLLATPGPCGDPGRRQAGAPELGNRDIGCVAVGPRLKCLLL